MKFKRESVVWTTVIRPRNTRSLNCRSEQLGPRFSINVRSWLASRPSRDAGRRQSSARIPTCTYLQTWEENPPLPFCLNLDCTHLYVILCEYLFCICIRVLFDDFVSVPPFFPSFFLIRYEYRRVSSILNCHSGNNRNWGQVTENFDFHTVFRLKTCNFLI